MGKRCLSLWNVLLVICRDRCELPHWVRIFYESFASEVICDNVFSTRCVETSENAASANRVAGEWRPRVSAGERPMYLGQRTTLRWMLGPRGF